MYQQMGGDPSHRPLAAISIAYVPSMGKHTMQIMVPLGVSLAKGLVIQTAAFKAPTLHYHHCDLGGCYVEVIMPNVSIESLENGGAGVKIKIVADDGRSQSMNLSLKGFAAAHTAMVKFTESRLTSPASFH
jgi:invasion protein IalB